MNFLYKKGRKEKNIMYIFDTIFHYYFVHIEKDPTENYLFWQKLKLHVLMNLCEVPAYTQYISSNTVMKESHKAITANFLFIFSSFISYSYLIFSLYHTYKDYKARNQTFYRTRTNHI